MWVAVLVTHKPDSMLNLEVLFNMLDASTDLSVLYIAL